MRVAAAALILKKQNTNKGDIGNSGGKTVRIALINENSQAPKNELIFSVLKEAAAEYGHKVYNYGRYSEKDTHERSYVQAGLLAGILLNAGAADFVITGCGTGEGAMLACNAFPGVFCGYVAEPTDAILFRRVNNGNAISMGYAKGFGWGAELNLKNVFHALLSTEGGSGYPEEWAEAEKRNKKILDGVKQITQKDMLTVLKEIDREFLLGAIAEETFPELFFDNCDDNEVSRYIKEILVSAGDK